MLCCEQGLSHGEAAAILEIPKRTLSRHVGEGLEELRKALSRAGYPAAVAVIIGGLAQTAPPVPATLAATLAKLVALGPTSGAGATAAAVAAKGGSAMKIIAGVVLAGALAGGAALFFGPPTAHRLPPAGLASPPAAKGLSYEHYAFTSWLADEMNGPRREAVGRGPGPLDEDFNCWLGGRVIRAEDGMVVSVAGGLPEFGQDEGPAAFLPRLSPIRGTGYGQSIGGWLVVGLPLKGGDKGCLYAYSDTHIMRIWKNADKGGRWWAKIVAGPGKAEIPGGRVYMGQAWRKGGEKQDKAVFFTNAGFYVMEEGAGGVKFTCLLSMDAFKGHLPDHSAGAGRKALPTLGVVDSGGNFYLGYYFAHGWEGAAAARSAAIQRVSPDGTKVEPYATSAKGATTGQDGPGMSTGWFCGPHFGPPRGMSPFYPADVLV